MVVREKYISFNRIGCYMLFLYWLLKPYYLFESGGLQVADMFILLSFAAVIASRSRLTIRKVDLLFIGFVIAASIVNVIHMMITYSNSFLYSTLYYVFNLIGILLFVYFIEDEFFLKNIKMISVFNIFVQLLVWVFGFGRMYGSSRYKGTFNDPNQFAFFVFTMLLIIYLLKKREKEGEANIVKRIDIVFLLSYLAAAVLIVLSASVGVLFGFAAFSVLGLVMEINNRSKAVTIVSLIFVALFLIMLVAFGSSYGLQLMLGLSKNSVFLNRIITKVFSLISADAGASFIADRNIDTVVRYPFYFLVGAGEGMWNRFVVDGTAVTGEIHSTPIALWFCYGLLPFALIAGWVKKNIEHCPKYAYPALLALALESFTLVNHRQLMFWIIIVLCGAAKAKKRGAL